ncbi:acetate/propionate family kinase [Alkalibacter saccharofermentans]|uniref:Acetate kinase n=1 Tax=Alkalibacter saccharofermentans DSM 14828 TaxID=1120975 RepID=A0A1M4S5D4_9FIRM|nr:acetate kinase [Alkalibacter saccharofermentans]SHE27422.1 acetate kinase [Alkalibacter saccharofermentans DSM 14828]
MNLLVINCGSSSLKYQLINMEDESVMAKGLVEKIGLETGIFTHSPSGKHKIVQKESIPNHTVALNMVMTALTESKYGVIDSLSEITAIGHRIVHGGEYYSESVLIDDNVMEALEKCIELAPLHNPANITGVNACKELLPEVPQVAVFDTAFHQSMPSEAYTYPLPYEYYEKYKVRKYGFHGTSHKYVSNRTAAFLGKSIEDLKIITCHLGNGASIAAVKNGHSVDTTMGFTPLEGLAMGTRCGSIDPSIVTFLMEKEKLSTDEIYDILNKESGVLGISGVSSDFRDIEAAAENGNKRAILAIDVFNYKVKTSIGAYAAAMDGVDAIVFTAGLGENSASNRKAICEGLSYLGITIDDERNKIRGEENMISTTDSKVKVLVIPTDEEMAIARDTKDIVKGNVLDKALS